MRRPVQDFWIRGRIVVVAYTGFGPPTTDLWYDGGDLYLHMWQTHRGPGQLGSKDPVALGEPIAVGGDIEWRANPLSPVRSVALGLSNTAPAWLMAAPSASIPMSVVMSDC